METKILNSKEFQSLIYDGNLPKLNYSNDLKQIRWFSYDDLGWYFGGSKEYSDSLIFVVSFDDEHIYGVTKFAYFTGSKHYSISYCSTNKNFLNKGICFKMIELLTTYFKLKYPNDILTTSQYSVSGWKYLRPTLIKLCLLKSVQFNDNIIGYMDDDQKYSEEFYTLRDLSIEITGLKQY